MTPTPDHPHGSPNRVHDEQFFYKYVSAEVAKIIISTRKLRWSSPILFNDPFDVNQELPLNFDEAELNIALAEKVALLVEQGVSSVGHPELATLLDMATHVDPDVRKKMVKDLRQKAGATTLGQIQALDRIKASWRKRVPKLRILCLSKLNDVIPMWQHYADEYKGVVLEFEAVDETDSAFLVARQVDYQDYPIDISDVETWANGLVEGPEALMELINQYQYIKATSWKYEEEWRIVSPGTRQGETGLFADYGFSPRELTGLYFGTQCSPKDRDIMLSLLVYGLDHVSAHEAFEDRHQGKFDFRPLTL